jgi:hypothetical protein
MLAATLLAANACGSPTTPLPMSASPSDTMKQISLSANPLAPPRRVLKLSIARTHLFSQISMRVAGSYITQLEYATPVGPVTVLEHAVAHNAATLSRLREAANFLSKSHRKVSGIVGGGVTRNGFPWLAARANARQTLVQIITPDYIVQTKIPNNVDRSEITTLVEGLK